MAAYTAIDDPSAYFKVQLYTGNGSANHAITFDDTDTDMQPDIVWIKNRDATDGHCFFDSVRGATKLLATDSNADEDTDTDTLDSFTSDGFQVDADVKVNTNTEKYVSWNWKGGTTSGINATGADITPSAYSFNQTSGVSIIKYSGNSTSGAEVAHGLAAVPHLMIIKNIDYSSGEGWQVYHHKNTAAPETDALALHDNGATQDQASRWNDTAPGSVLFTLGNDISVNTGYTYLGLIFSEKQGFSKFGSYTGGGTKFPFIYTGFRPAYLLIKNIETSSTNWTIYDNKRPGYNVDNAYLEANSTDPDATGGYDSDFFIGSNGFKPLSNNNHTNESDKTFIYAAFAEAPFVNSNGVPCNAR